jgi:UDP-2,3-diacylglucosamine pyrophosphatase LpxH
MHRGAEVLYPPTFTDVFVISDLHLGGKAGFQAFNQGDRLAKFIKHLAGLEGDSLALVLNGDVVDFLAEENATYFDPAGACAKLERIRGDAAFADVFSALKVFTAHPGRHLIVVLGNHDVELALPDVRELLIHRLTSDAASRGRITFATDGSGWSCRVGNARLLCVHGDETDDWNVVDHRALLEVARQSRRGVECREWDANGGTRLVIDVMNGIKREFPFVDLLKPETRAVLPVLAALKPDVVTKLASVIAAASARTRDGLRMRAGWLGETDSQAKRGEPVDGMEELYRVLVSISPSVAADQSADLLERVLEARRRGGLAGLSDDDEQLGFETWRARVRAWLKRAEPVEIVRTSLRRLLLTDRSFDLQHRDECFEFLNEKVGDSVHFIAAGHTHLRRAIRRGSAGGSYFNTGTWMRLIRLERETLDDPVNFKKIFDVLGTRDMGALDRAEQNGRPLVLWQPTAARIRALDGYVEGALYNVQKDGVPVIDDETRTEVRV